MFCSKCGKGEQQSESYCRNCGEFLIDPGSRASLVTRFLGISSPEKQLNLTLAIDLTTAIVSGFLLFSLKGYFDGAAKATGVPTSPLVYVLYVFLGLVSVWQLFSFTVGTAFKKKLSASRRAHLQAQAVNALPPANDTNVIPASVTETTTRNLEKLPRSE